MWLHINVAHSATERLQKEALNVEALFTPASFIHPDCYSQRGVQAAVHAPKAEICYTFYILAAKHTSYTLLILIHLSRLTNQNYSQWILSCLNQHAVKLYIPVVPNLHFIHANCYSDINLSHLAGDTIIYYPMYFLYVDVTSCLPCLASLT